MTTLSHGHLQELHALQQFNDALGRPSHIRRSHWRQSGYGKLVRAGLVEWGDPPDGFDKKLFAGTTITALGRKILEDRK